MILVKATGRVLKLSQCGISVEKRFAFYDQIHTTGMDIKHALNARAALTLGKDMVFRDLAQGAFRMRGIGVGQTVSMLVIPEVQQLMSRQLAKAGYARAPARRPTGRRPTARSSTCRRGSSINSMRTERVQFDQLCTRTSPTSGGERLRAAARRPQAASSVRADAASGFVLDMLGEAFVSNRDGATSKAALDGKVLGIYFQGTSAPHTTRGKGLQL